VEEVVAAAEEVAQVAEVAKTEKNGLP